MRSRSTANRCRGACGQHSAPVWPWCIRNSASSLPYPSPKTARWATCLPATASFAGQRSVTQVAGRCHSSDWPWILTRWSRSSPSLSASWSRSGGRSWPIPASWCSTSRPRPFRRKKRRDCFACSRTSATHGTTIIFISHRVVELYSLCDSATVLARRQRRRTRFTDLASASPKELVMSMVGRQLDLLARRTPVPVDRLGPGGTRST